MNGITFTMAIEDYDYIDTEIMGNGIQITMLKYAFPGMAWQGFYHNPEGNIFGIRPSDEKAK